MPPIGQPYFVSSRKTTRPYELRRHPTRILGRPRRGQGPSIRSPSSPGSPTRHRPNSLAGYGLAKSETDVLITKGINKYFYNENPTPSQEHQRPPQPHPHRPQRQPCRSAAGCSTRTTPTRSSSTGPSSTPRPPTSCPTARTRSVRPVHRQRQRGALPVRRWRTGPGRVPGRSSTTWSSPHPPPRPTSRPSSRKSTPATGANLLPPPPA
jgi:hypothetical protein